MTTTILEIPLVLKRLPYNNHIMKFDRCVKFHRDQRPVGLYLSEENILNDSVVVESSRKSKRRCRVSYKKKKSLVLEDLVVPEDGKQLDFEGKISSVNLSKENKSGTGDVTEELPTFKYVLMQRVPTADGKSQMNMIPVGGA